MLEAFSLLICCWKAEWGPDAGIFITFIGLALEYGNKLGLALKKGKQIWLFFCIKRKHKDNSVQEACDKGFEVHIGIWNLANNIKKKKEKKRTSDSKFSVYRQ